MSFREEQETIAEFERQGVSYSEYLRGRTPRSKFGHQIPASLPRDETATMSPGYDWIAARGE